MSNVETARSWGYNAPDSQTTGDSSEADWACESPPIVCKELRWRAAAFPSSACACASPHCTACASPSVRRPPRRPGASNSALSDMETRMRTQAGNPLPAKNLHGKLSSISAQCSGKCPDTHHLRPVKTCGGGDSVCAAGNVRHSDSRPQQQQMQGGDAPAASPPTSSPSPFPSPWQQQQVPLPAGAGTRWPWVPAGSPASTVVPWYPLPPPPGPWQGGAGAWSEDEQSWQAPNIQRSDCGMECWAGCACASSRSRMDTSSEATQDSKPGSRLGRESFLESHRDSPGMSTSPRCRVPPTTVALSAAVSAAHSAAAAASATSSCVNEWPRLMFGSQMPLRKELDDLLVILKSTVDEVLVAASELIPSELSDLQLIPETSMLVMSGAPSAAAAALHNYCALGAFTHGLMDGGDCMASSMAVQLMDLIADTALELSRIPARVDLSRARFDISDDDGSGDAALSRSLRESVRPPTVSSDDPQFIGQYRAYLDLIRLPRDEGAGGDTTSLTSQATHFDDLVGSSAASAMILKTLDSRSEVGPSETTLAAPETSQDERSTEVETDRGGGSTGRGNDRGGVGSAGMPAEKEICSLSVAATVINTSATSSTEEDEGMGGSECDVGDICPRDGVSRCAEPGGSLVSDSADTSDAPLGGSGGGDVGGGDGEGTSRLKDTVVLFQRSDTDSNQEVKHAQMLSFQKAHRRMQAADTCERKNSCRWHQAVSSETESAILVSPSTDTEDAVEMDVIVMPAVRCGGQERSSAPSATATPLALSPRPPDPAASPAPATDSLQQGGKSTGVSKSKVKVLVNLDELTQRGCWNTEMCTMKQIQKITAPEVLTQTQGTAVTTVKVRPSAAHTAVPSHSGSSPSSESRAAARRRLVTRPALRRRRRSSSRDRRPSRSPSPARHPRATHRRWTDERGDRDHEHDRDRDHEHGHERDGRTPCHRRQSGRSPEPSCHRRSGYERRGSYRSAGSEDVSEDERREHRNRRGPRLMPRSQLPPGQAKARRRLQRIRPARASSASSRFSRRERRRHESRRAPASPRTARWHRHITSTHDAVAAANAPHALRVRVVASRPRYDDPTSGDWACEWARVSEDGRWGARREPRGRRSPAHPFRHHHHRPRYHTPEVEEEEAEEESVEEVSGGSGFVDVEGELAAEVEEEESEESVSGGERGRRATATRGKGQSRRSSRDSFSLREGHCVDRSRAADPSGTASSGEDVPDSAAALQQASRQLEREARHHEREVRRVEQAAGDRGDCSSPRRRTSNEASTRCSSPRLQDPTAGRVSRRLSRPSSHRVPSWPAGKGTVLDIPGITTLVDVVANSASGFLKSCEVNDSSRSAARLSVVRAQAETVTAATNTEGSSHREGRKEGTADEDDFISAVGSPRALLLPFLTSPGTDTETESEVHEESSGSGETGPSDGPDLVTTVQRTAEENTLCRSPIINVEESQK